jgi:hypothetical protein
VGKEGEAEDAHVRVHLAAEEEEEVVEAGK